ncbi:MAG: PTS sugar transporter subunit IIA [Treponema sp.]|jgi:PTS system nitrogen regulatory IIA component|nr:PTS sugar transporter subunit IIA [Treponema sp.]
MDKNNDDESLAELINRGGVYTDIPGNSPREVLAGIVETVPLPAGIPRESLLKAVMEREALMSTGIGRGIALPHPRNPAMDDEKQQFVAIVFPVSPVNWNALDGEMVHTVMLIVSASAKQHLHILSKLNFLCQQENFYQLLQDKASREEIVQAVREAEQTWKKE